MGAVFIIIFFGRFVMRLVDVYRENKSRYDKYIIMIKCGYFYEIYGEDAYIMNKIFGYKVKNVGGMDRAGFPINSYNKVINRLNRIHINYYIIGGDRVKFKDNNYDKYMEYVYER